MLFFFFFFNDTATTEIYTLSLHDALPIWEVSTSSQVAQNSNLASHSTCSARSVATTDMGFSSRRSEEHTSELQSRLHLVCRLLLEKKKKRLAKLIVGVVVTA